LPQACGIGRVKQPDFLDGILQVACDDIRLNPCDKVDLIDVEDLIHPLERQYDSTARRHGAAAVTRAGASRHERYPSIVAQSCELRDFLRRAWKDDKIGGSGVFRAVRTVRFARGQVLKDERAADNAGSP
jgi:hypothetical protein